MYMADVKVIELNKSVYADNNSEADSLRQELKSKGTFLLNLMSSPGSGKTTTLINTINRIKNQVKIAVMEADVESDVDAIKIKEKTGVQSIQIHTDGLCHVNAGMMKDSLKHMDLEDVDLCILENIGNLVCPAEFDTGASKNIMLLSVPEGDDKPLKYPLMFSIVDLVIINKIDVMPVFDFDMDRFTKNVRELNPNANIIAISAKTGEGVQQFADWLLTEIRGWKNL